MVIRLQCAFKLSGGFGKVQTAGPAPPHSSESVGLGWGLSLYISNKLPGAHLLVQGPHFEKQEYTQTSKTQHCVTAQIAKGCM